MDKDLTIEHYDFTDMLSMYAFPFEYTDYHIVEARKKPVQLESHGPVSYTHLTLPTIYSV